MTMFQVGTCIPASDDGLAFRGFQYWTTPLHTHTHTGLSSWKVGELQEGEDTVCQNAGLTSDGEFIYSISIDLKQQRQQGCTEIPHLTSPSC